jgi:dihydroneopterin aldolase/D-erythro-7,8-dihydroneopterin triphosphate epimerase
VDTIHIKGLLVRCILGTDEDERREKQDVLLHLHLSADLAKAVQSDSLQESVDYRSVKKQVLAEVELTDYHLLETLAERVAAICLSFSGVLEVRVEAEKPGALRFARSVGVEIVRRKD